MAIGIYQHRSRNALPSQHALEMDLDLLQSSGVPLTVLHSEFFVKVAHDEGFQSDQKG